MLLTFIMPVISLALCIVITDDPFTVPDEGQRIFKPVRLVFAPTDDPCPNLNNIAIRVNSLAYQERLGLRI